MFDQISDVKVFAVSASLLYVKFLATTMIQGRKAFAAGTRMAEDNKLPMAKGKPCQGQADMADKAVKLAVEDEMRWKRIIQNDLESMPMAFVVFWSAISAQVNPDVTKTLLLAYTAARISHTASYALSMPRARMACWMTGSFCIVTAAVNAVMASLS
ncbi:hypothetical protein BBJ28_00026002 [Nothophytophthora sp. Chile5]|nr:hypothetical protein BBJ28_00026002 [Nothophytophthora sp. Chile5]